MLRQIMECKEGEPLFLSFGGQTWLALVLNHCSVLGCVTLLCVVQCGRGHTEMPGA